jgi:hypothetical protein
MKTGELTEHEQGPIALDHNAGREAFDENLMLTRERGSFRPTF